MEHCLLYLLLYGALLGALTASYANFRLFTEVGRGVFIRLVAALTAGRPVFAFLGALRLVHISATSRPHLGHASSPSQLRLGRVSAGTALTAQTSAAHPPPLTPPAPVPAPPS